ncbi:hypothetical protein CJ030_MR7G022000 [Morella rubra]|uniref:Uncharacterized protein n=1 Tax=Morella rubra TaxID=262757 RepID=A0A6A1UXS0_9ROSI|nr:hypothetical protein CJ030_MR7G022000 [Morella rubra]
MPLPRHFVPSVGSVPTLTHHQPKNPSSTVPTSTFLPTINDCPKNNIGFEAGCVAKALGRFSFQPLRENPLFGPSSSA